ncbi:MAG TPA: AAA family ATPase [Ktedonosporobacter sp.]|nr:AAA family ATPase [Ktedonosporobacter sp.]
MERAERHQEQPDPGIITLPPGALIALCGPAGSGKSTLAGNLVKSHPGFVETMIVSSDHCRALVCDDENNQQVSRDSFDLFHYIIHKRMFQKRLTIADSTALKADARHKLLELAQKHHVATCLLIFSISAEVCRERDQARVRMVGEQVIAYHMGLLQQTLLDVPNEGWQQIHILDTKEIERDVKIVLERS